jgi:hypothetical protein
VEHANCVGRIQDQPNVDTGNPLWRYFRRANTHNSLRSESAAAAFNHYGNIDLVAPEQETLPNQRRGRIEGSVSPIGAKRWTYVPGAVDGCPAYLKIGLLH